MRRCAHEEAPVGAGQAHALARPQLLVHPARALAAGHVADVELDLARLRRAAGDGEGARLALAGDLQVDVLARLEDDGRVELDPHALDGGREVLDARDHAREVLHGQVLRVGLVVDLGLDHGVGLQRCAAGQALALVALVVHEGEAAGLAVFDLAVGDLDLAGAAQPMAAGVRQVDAGAQGGVEDGLALLHVDHLAERFNGELVAHGVLAYFRFNSY